MFPVPITKLRNGRIIAGPTMSQVDGTSSSPPAPPVASTYVVLPPARDPGVFSGQDGVDIDKWINLYERISASYRWDPTLMLANVLFYLDGPPRVWFETHEADITSWESFKEKIRDLFGNTAGRQMAARNQLATRAQTSTESYVAYIHDVIALCRQVDEHMPESEKVSHVLKGIADDAFNLLVYTNVATVDSIIKECRRFEQAKSRRITQRFTRLPNTAATSSCEAARQPPTYDNVTRIVRREIEAACPAPIQPPVFTTHTTDPSQPSVAFIQAVVRQEFANLGLPSACPLTRPAVRPYSPGNARRSSPTLPFRNPTEWRTPDDQPICFSCHQPGHVSRYCRRRWSNPPRQTYPTYMRPTTSTRSAAAPSNVYSSSHEPLTNDATSPVRRYSRSPSPQRRQSRSPQPRRFPSPTFSGRSQQEN